MKDVDWCFAVMAGVDPTEPRPHIRCDRCGEKMVTVLPLRLETYVETLRGFARAHANCKAKAAA
jgi:hypothetical protein